MAGEAELAAAVEAFVRANEETPALVVVDFVLVAASKGFTDAGEQLTAVTIESQAAAYAARGLLAEAIVRMDADTLERYSGHD